MTKPIVFDQENLKEIDHLHSLRNSNRIYKSRSHAVRSLTEIGLFVLRTKDQVNPAKLDEFLQSKTDNDQIMQWLSNLSTAQRHGLKDMISMIDEGKTQQITEWIRDVRPDGA